MRRRFARLGVVVVLTVGLVALVPLFAPSAMAADCNNSSLTINVTCVSVPGVGTVTSSPTEPTSTGCVKDDCATVTKGGMTLHKAEEPKGSPPPGKKPDKTVKPAPIRGAVLGYSFLRHDNGPSDFHTGSFDNTLPLESKGWRNGIYRNPTPAIAEAPAPSMWSGITAPAAFTSFVLGTLLLVSAFSFKRLMLN